MVKDVNLHISFVLPRMARTKKTAQHRPSGVPEKTPRASAPSHSGPAESRPHRYRPGTRARMDLHKWWFREPERLIIRRLPFGRTVRKIAKNFMAATRFQPQAFDALHYATESHLVKLFEDANLLTRHTKRIRVYNSYIKLVERFPGEM